VKRLLAVVAMAFLLLGVACSSGEGSSTDGSDSSGDGSAEAPFELSDEPVATTEVNLPKSYKFEPAVITVEAGDEVTWTNEDDFPHNVHLLDDDVTEDLPVGESATMVFDDPGDYYYECSIHPQQMKGKIIVE
jgi:plastocyanin